MKSSVKYRGMSDEELIELLRGGEEEVCEFLCSKYKNLVSSRAKSMYILGAGPEDLIQEGMIGLFKAVRDYDSSKEARFVTFAELCISRQMLTAIQAADRKKHMPLNTYVSIYSDDEKKDAGSVFGEFAYATVLSPEQEFIDKENTEILEKTIYESLSAMEKKVLGLKITGMDYNEIAKILEKSPKSIDNTEQRIKKKVREILQNYRKDM